MSTLKMNPGRDVTSRLAPMPRQAAKALYGSAYRARWGFLPPPSWSDWSRYEFLLRAIERYRLAEVPGDVVEIGVLLGGGTYKLCRYFERAAPTKRVIAVDIFDPGFDLTPSGDGRTMAELYAVALDGRGQREVFEDVTRDCTNLVVVAGDSATVELPTEAIAFAYVDGNHSPEYVRSDFELIWARLSPGGVIAFDDYGLDLAGVTHTLHELIGEHAEDVGRVWFAGDKTIFFQRRGPDTNVDTCTASSAPKLVRQGRFALGSLR